MNPQQKEDFLNGPALAPPRGVEANFVDPPSLENVARASLQLLLATSVVGLRLYTKVRVLKNMLSEDCKMRLCRGFPRQTLMSDVDTLLVAWVRHLFVICAQILVLTVLSYSSLPHSIRLFSCPRSWYWYPGCDYWGGHVLTSLVCTQIYYFVPTC